VRPDGPDVHVAVGVVNPSHDAILVSGNVEYYAPVLKDAGTAELRLGLGARCGRRSALDSRHHMGGVR